MINTESSTYSSWEAQDFFKTETDSWKLCTLQVSTLILPLPMTRTCNLPTLEIHMLSQVVKIFKLTVAHLPGILSCSIPQPWRGPLSAGIVTVNVKASDRTRPSPGIAISLTKDSTSELLRTLEYKWPLPGSSRNLYFKQCESGLLLDEKNSPHIRSRIPSTKNA